MTKECSKLNITIFCEDIDEENLIKYPSIVRLIYEKKAMQRPFCTDIFFAATNTINILIGAYLKRLYQV